MQFMAEAQEILVEHGPILIVTAIPDDAEISCGLPEFAGPPRFVSFPGFEYHLA